MATVVELRSQAKSLGIKGYSKMLKPELEQAIANASQPAVVSASVETTAKPISEDRVCEGTLTAVQTAHKPLSTTSKRLAAWLAGSRGTTVQPMDVSRRKACYVTQNVRQGAKLSKNGRYTSAQNRRMRKAVNKMDARETRALASMA